MFKIVAVNRSEDIDIAEDIDVADVPSWITVALIQGHVSSTYNSFWKLEDSEYCLTPDMFILPDNVVVDGSSITLNADCPLSGAPLFSGSFYGAIGLTHSQNGAPYKVSLMSHSYFEELVGFCFNPQSDKTFDFTYVDQFTKSQSGWLDYFSVEIDPESNQLTMQSDALRSAHQQKLQQKLLSANMQQGDSSSILRQKFEVIQSQYFQTYGDGIKLDLRALPFESIAEIMTIIQQAHQDPKIDFSCEKIVYLSVSMTKLDEYPDFLGQFPKLQVLILQGCALSSFDKFDLADYPDLRVLSLQSNNLEHLPQSVADDLDHKTGQLQFFNAEGNLERFPARAVK